MIVVTDAIPPRMGSIGIMVILLCWGLLFCPGVSRTYSYVQNPCQKENAFFEQKSQGGELGLYALMDAYTKTYTKIHFRMRYKTQKAPPKRSLSYSAKTQMGSWFIVECFRPFDRLRDLVYTLLFTALCDDFTQSYCARRRVSRASSLAHDRAEKQATEWLQSTVYRGVLSEFHNTFMTSLFPCLNPLYVVECFRSLRWIYRRW